jgi:F-type H+-transporting ATPase subunit b
MTNVRGIASDAATAIVQQLTGATPDRKVVDGAVEASMKG